MIKAIVLDIGGVVLRTEDRSARQALEKQYNLPKGGADELVFNSNPAKESTIGRITSDQIWQNVADTLSLSSEALQEFQDSFWQGDRIDQEIIEFLKSVQEKYHTAFLTNAWVGARDMLAQRFDLIEGDPVDHILISSELGVAKPDPAIYHILIETIGCFSEQILFVDDFIENILAANAIGIRTIHYKTGMDLIMKIREEIDHN